MSNPYIATYTGNGSQTDFTVPDTYIRQAHVSVELDEVPTTDYVFLTTSTIRFDVAPGDGVEIVITDQAPGDPLNIYSGSTGISALSLNENFKQSVQLADFAINAAKDIVEGNIPPNTITRVMLGSEIVSKGKTSAGVQASLERADSAIQAIANAVTTAMLTALSVTTGKIAAAAVTTNKLAEGAVSKVKTTTAVQNSLDKADSATQLGTTPRTLWGQTFDASVNISGNLNSVGSITGSGQVVVTSANDTSLFLRAPGTGSVVAEAQGTGTVQLRAGASLIRFWNAATTFYTSINLQSLTANRSLTMANGNVVLTPGTMVPTTGVGASGTWGITATNCSRSVVAGNGVTGGGALSADRTITLGTPSNITDSSTNSVTASSHTHAITNAALIPSAHNVVGAYQICRNSSGGTIAAGGIVAGSVLNPSNGLDGGDWIAISPPPTGNWRLMSSGGLATNRHALFQRVS